MPLAPRRFGDEIRQLAARLVLRLEAQIEIRPVEGMHENLWRRRKQPLDDVGSCRAVRGRREGDRLRAAQCIYRPANLAILGPEIMAPFGHAMGFVDRDPPDAASFQRGRQPVHREALGRNEQEPQFARTDQPPCVVRFFSGVVGIQCRRGDAHSPHLLGLVAHQRDERRNHQRQPALEQRRQLIAHALAAAGRHHRKNGPAIQNGADHLRLSGTEVIISEDRFEKVARAGQIPHRIRNSIWRRPLSLQAVTIRPGETVRISARPAISAKACGSAPVIQTCPPMSSSRSNRDARRRGSK